MLLSERKAEAEAWLKYSHDYALDRDKSERPLDALHYVYKAAAMSVIMFATARPNVHRDRVRFPSLTRRVSVCAETGAMWSSEYGIESCPSPVIVGTARNTDYSVMPRFMGGQQPAITREEFYIRRGVLGLDGIHCFRSDPDITDENWSLRDEDIKLPSRDRMNERACREDMTKFGREIVHVAVAMRCPLPVNVEQFQATEDYYRERFSDQALAARVRTYDI
jgi:hypothetical protein